MITNNNGNENSTNNNYNSNYDITIVTLELLNIDNRYFII